MARRRNKHLRPPRPLVTAGSVRRETKSGVTHFVRAIRAGQSNKDYRCPGCNQLVRSGAAHVVAWPEESPLGVASGLETRRHWHTYCWERA